MGRDPGPGPGSGPGNGGRNGDPERGDGRGGNVNTIGDANGNTGTEHASIFTSNGSLRPALGRTFAFLVDVSILLSRVEDDGKRGADKGTWNSGGGGSSVVKSGNGKWSENVVAEVLVDRYGGRVGRWCVLHGLN